MTFNFDNKFFNGLGKLVDCVVLSALWFIFSLPVFTIGASTTALYYTVHKSVVRSRSYVFQSFWSAFKSNFKQSTLMWLIMLVIYAVLYLDQLIMRNELENGTVFGPLYYVFVILMAATIIWNLYIFAYSARFENTKKALMQNAALIAGVNPGWSLLLLVLFVLAVLAVYLIPMLIFIIPAVLFLLYDLILERVFRKYMSEADLAREKEADMIDRE
jgi:uncharacterized membrane protein YesL